MNRVLVLAPHADDEILGCGGAIAKHIRQGDSVSVAVMTNAAEGAPELFSQGLVNQIREECITAHKSLGIKETIFEEFPAPQLEQYPQYKLATAISKLINQIKPTILYIPHKGDLHLDHGAIYNAALVAARPVGNQSVKKIYAYETLSETEWGHPTPEMAFVPNHFVALEEDDLTAKCETMRCFESQLHPFPHPRSEDAIVALARYRGATVGAVAAEAFMTIRSID